MTGDNAVRHPEGQSLNGIASLRIRLFFTR